MILAIPQNLNHELVVATISYSLSKYHKDNIGIPISLFQIHSPPTNRP